MPRWHFTIERIPPTIGIRDPNPRLDLERRGLRLYVEAQPWLHAVSIIPEGLGSARSVSAARISTRCWRPTRATRWKATFAPTRDWPVELLAWSAADRAGLLRDLDRLAERPGRGIDGPRSATWRTPWRPGSRRPGRARPWRS